MPGESHDNSLIRYRCLIDYCMLFQSPSIPSASYRTHSQMDVFNRFESSGTVKWLRTSTILGHRYPQTHAITTKHLQCRHGQTPSTNILSIIALGNTRRRSVVLRSISGLITGAIIKTFVGVFRWKNFALHSDTIIWTSDLYCVCRPKILWEPELGYRFDRRRGNNLIRKWLAFSFNTILSWHNAV